MKKLFFISFIVFTLGAVAQKQVKVMVSQPGAQISPAMWGVFFEDINFGADGGLYAELVKNRSFEFTNPMMGWKEIKPVTGSGKLLIINSGMAENPRYARITVDGAQGYAISNEGFRGMGVKKDNEYTFSMLGRSTGNLRVRVELVNDKGKIAEATVPNFAVSWSKRSVRLRANADEGKAKMNIIVEGKGALDIDLVSLFPLDTWKGRPNGLRADLVQMLADLKPGFIRFPGGCIVEGYDLSLRYQWKKTIGPADARKLMINRWNTEMRNRQAPDYFQSFGLGFYEYFQLAEDLGAAPLPILNCGMACQFNSKEVVPLGQLDPFIQDALDLVEFANGAVTTKWGKVRAGLGHPAPFNLKMLGIGNEQWDEQYIERYKEFEKVFRKRYPAIQLVAAAGPEPADARFDYAWKEFRKLAPGFVDEHYYKPPEWFLAGAGRYDNYPRTGPKVFAGEYAAHAKEDKESESRNSWLSAMAEAAFMTGLERNADVVQMASYAPLFAHVDAWQWRPDLIWFDNLQAVGSPNYYVQKLFSNNRGTQVLPALVDGKVAEGNGFYASAALDKPSGEVIVKMVNTSAEATDINIKLDGVMGAAHAKLQLLTSDAPYAYNSIKEPKKVFPISTAIDTRNGSLSLSLPKETFAVVRIAVH